MREVGRVVSRMFTELQEMQFKFGTALLLVARLYFACDNPRNLIHLRP